MTVEDIRSIALKLPHTTEDIKWGSDLCFCIAEKMFCVTSMEGDCKISIKVEVAEFEELCQRQGFTPAPYMARNKWVLIDESARFSKQELEAFIKKSYELVKSKLSKKIQEKLAK
ncbi:MAG: MmcQ/YjbR family DNA-binding protein [Bacteroidetes bacterium]|nr:MmcQ/YjbR family DNA-binding protein [Bacteroidota bacterium]MBI3481528.1 MmcQ/YjbR family DNA-binding protein [Bacteroidota bacterium]